MKLKRLYPPQKSVNSLHSETGTGCEVAGCPPLRKEALLFFAGWGMDETPFMHNLPPNKDLIICYDYRSLDFDSTLLSTYDGIYVVAWSMGVWAASQVLPDSNLPLKQSIAINGTPFPIDDMRGIPPAIFEGTLNNLNEATLQKFRRRMCGSGSAFQAFLEIAPQRPVEELKEELAAIGRQYSELSPSTFVWNKAIIGESDHIFPPKNQEQAWQKYCNEIQRYDGAHYDEKILKEKSRSCRCFLQTTDRPTLHESNRHLSARSPGATTNRPENVQFVAATPPCALPPPCCRVRLRDGYLFASATPFVPPGTLAAERPLRRDAP